VGGAEEIPAGEEAQETSREEGCQVASTIGDY
jgi:hypothetical protein